MNFTEPELRKLGFAIRGNQAVPIDRKPADRTVRTIKAFLDCPIRSEANVGGKLRHSLKRKAEQKEAVIAALGAQIVGRGKPRRVTFVLLSSQELDQEDNLAMAFKHVRDTVAELANFNDRERVWHYEQRKPFHYETRGFWCKVEF